MYSVGDCILVLVLLGVYGYGCASAQSFSVCVGVVWIVAWVARYFTGVVDHVGRLSNKYSYRRNLGCMFDCCVSIN